MRIVWLDITASYAHASLALPLIHAASRNVVDADWYVVRAVIADDAADIAARVAALRPDLLCGTVYLFNRRLVLQVVRRIQALPTPGRVVLGGPEFLGDNAAFLAEEPGIDAVVRGEGEKVFGQMLQRWQAPMAWGELPGVCTLHRPAAGVLPPMAPASPATAWPAALESAFFRWDGPFVQIETARGCAGTCRYCTSCADVPVRRLSLSDVRALLRRLHARGVEEVRVLDRTFNANARRCIALLRLFRDICPGVRFHVELHPRYLASTVRKALASAPAGSLHLEVGWQTGATGARRAVGRRGSITRAWEGIRWLCAQDNLSCHVDILAGLPGQTLADVLEDLTRLTALGPAEMQLETLKVLPGTPLREEAKRLGVTYAPDPPYDVLRTSQMSVADLHQARLLSRLTDRFYNHSGLQPAVRLAAARAGFYTAFLAFLVEQGALAQPLTLERRFRLLHAFGAADDAVTEALALAWLHCGLSPVRGIIAATQWRQPIPGDARRMEGVAPDVHGRMPRCWVVDVPSGRYWFVYAGDSRHRPSAVYRSRRHCETAVSQTTLAAPPGGNGGSVPADP